MSLFSAKGRVPYKSKKLLTALATSFLEENWNGGFPIDVEAICDNLGIGIVPIKNLNFEFGIDAFITSDFKTIFVDDDEFSKESSRYRFSIAHELGHYVLHRDFYPKDIKGLDAFLGASANYSNRDSEFQANYFAGKLLVPDEELRLKMSEVFKGNPKETAWQMSASEKEAAYNDIIRHFKVSGQTLSIRLADVYPELAARAL